MKTNNKKSSIKKIRKNLSEIAKGLRKLIYENIELTPEEKQELIGELIKNIA